MKDLSFREKSLWLMCVSLVVAFGFYFWNALAAYRFFGTGMSDASTRDVMPRLGTS
jgi:hypothetical protein